MPCLVRFESGFECSGVLHEFDFLLHLYHERMEVAVCGEVVSFDFPIVEGTLYLAVGFSQFCEAECVMPPMHLRDKFCKGFLLVAQLLLRLADYRLPRNASHFRCLSRRAANAVTQSGKAHQLFCMRIQKTGYGFKTLEYESLCSKGRGFWHALKKLVKLLVFNSQLPLHLVSGLSFAASLVAFLFAVYAVLIKLFLYGVVDGWTSTFLAISLFAMLQFLILGFIGEYLARMLDEQSRQSSYSTVFEKNSLTMVDADRINVMESSTETEPNKVQTARNN